MTKGNDASNDKSTKAEIEGILESLAVIELLNACVEGAVTFLEGWF